MKKTIISALFILFSIAFLNNEAKSQSLDIANLGGSDAAVTYCSYTSSCISSGSSVSTTNPCASAPPCSVTFDIGGCPNGCVFTVPLSPCPVAGTPYSYSVSGLATNCAVQNMNFSITIDATGNVVIQFMTY